jgi:hypothetical protein
MTHPHPDPSAEAAWNEIQPILDAELDALPDEARRLLIAHYLQEKSYSEVAAELGLPKKARQCGQAAAMLMGSPREREKDLTSHEVRLAPRSPRAINSLMSRLPGRP